MSRQSLLLLLFMFVGCAGTGSDHEETGELEARSRVGQAKEDIAAIEFALNNYAIENTGRWPESLQELVAPDENGFTFLKGPSVPLDPWENDYGYEPPVPGQSMPRIICYGADGKPGGEGKNRDFDNNMIRNGDI